MHRQPEEILRRGQMNMRLNPRERDLLARAARAAGLKLTEWGRSVLVAEAKRMLKTD